MKSETEEKEGTNNMFRQDLKMKTKVRLSYSYRKKIIIYVLTILGVKCLVIYNLKGLFYIL